MRRDGTRRDWIGKGYLHPEVMITHVGGLDSAAQATFDMLETPGGKRLGYTHVNMPMTALDDFEKLGESDPFYAELDRICTANSGLWCKEAEDYLLANAPKVVIGAPNVDVVDTTAAGDTLLAEYCWRTFGPDRGRDAAAWAVAAGSAACLMPGGSPPPPAVVATLKESAG